jgi:hypothetical protein
MVTMFQTFGGDPIQPAYSSYIQIDLDANAQLAWPIQFQNTNDIVFNYMNVVPTNNGFTLTLPDARDVSVGASTIINNPSAFSFTLNKADGTLLFTFAAGVARYIILTDNTTEGGTWNTHPFTAGGSAVTSINMTSSSDNVVVGGVPITSAGTITLALAKDLLELSTFGMSTGIACRTAADTWALRSITGTANQIAITNPAGIAGNINVALEQDITGINSIVVDLVKIQNNEIITTGANQNLLLDPNGTGTVRIGGAGLRIDSGQPAYFYADNAINFVSFEAGAQTVDYNLVWPTVAPANGQVLGFVAGTELAWFNVTSFGGPSTVQAIARYLNTTGTLEDSSVLISDLGAVTGATSVAAGNIRIGGIGGTLPNTIVSTNADGDIIFTPNGVGGVRVESPFFVTDANVFVLQDADNSNFSGFKAADVTTTDYISALPPAYPFNSQVMASTTNQAAATALAWRFMSSDRNLLVNGGMDIWQRGTSFTNATVVYTNNDLRYCADCWKIISNGNDIASVSRSAGPTPPAAGDSAGVAGASRYAWRFTVTNGGAKFGILQILEGQQSQDLRNSYVKFSLIGTAIGATNWKMAVIGWSGAENSPTSDPIAAWGASGTNPTLAANWAYQPDSNAADATAITFGAEYGTFSPGVITIANNVTNIGVMVWCDETTAVAGNTIDISCLLLTKGPNFTPYYQPDTEVELARSKRFYQKDVAYSVTPFTTATQSTQGTLIVSPIGAAVNIANAATYGNIQYEVEMTNAITPVVTVYPYTTVTNTGRVSNQAGVDRGANSGDVTNSTTKGFTLVNNLAAAATLDTTGFIQFHYVVASEF